MLSLYRCSGMSAQCAQCLPDNGKHQRNQQHQPGKQPWMGLSKQGKAFQNGKVYHDMKNINNGGNGTQFTGCPIRPWTVEGKLRIFDTEQNNGRCADQNPNGHVGSKLAFPLRGSQKESKENQANQLNRGKPEAAQNPLLIFMKEDPSANMGMPENQPFR